MERWIANYIYTMIVSSLFDTIILINILTIVIIFGFRRSPMFRNVNYSREIAFVGSLISFLYSFTLLVNGLDLLDFLDGIDDDIEDIRPFDVDDPTFTLTECKHIHAFKELILLYTKSHLFLDGISISFVILTTFIITLCIFITKRNIPLQTIYYTCFILLNLFLVAAFVTWNLLWFYVFFEAVLIPMFLIITIWGSRERKIKAGFYFFLYTVFGSFFMLTGILFVYLQTGTLFLNELLLFNFSLEKQLMLWFCFFFGFAIKIPMMPFHLWLPEAHVEAPTTGSVILASLLLKLGGYGFIRILLPLFPLATKYFSPLIYTMALISIIYSSIIALRQMDIKRIIAYSSIAHMNLVVLGIFSNTLYGVVGAIFLMIAHGIVSGALFLLIGVLYERYHTRLLNYYGGLVQVMPVFSTIFLFFSLANLSFPGTCNFIGELLILIGVARTNTSVMLLATSTMVASAAYSLWLFNRVCFGQLKTITIATKYSDINVKEWLVFLPLIVLTLFLGVWPNFIFERVLLCSNTDQLLDLLFVGTNLL